MKRTIAIRTLFIVAVLSVYIGCKKTGNISFSQVELPKTLTAENADLIIEGSIIPKIVYLDLNILRKFPTTSFTCSDPWDETEHTYNGVSIIGLLEYLKIDPSAVNIVVEAKNGYTIPIRLEDLKRYEYILAHTRDDFTLGSEASPEKLGNLIVAINFSKHKNIDIEVYKNQLAWQVNHIYVE